MGEYFQTIVDVDATADEADALAAGMLAWLVDTGVVLPEVTRCALGDGHAPGPRYASATTEAAPGLLTHDVNGLEIITGRTVFFSMGVDQVTCPRCEHVTVLSDGRVRLTEAWSSVSKAIDAWYAGGTGDHPCEACEQAVGINDWTWSPPWAFGYLGLKFWNWPAFSPDFLTEVSQRLGHRTVHPYGKI